LADFGFDAIDYSFCVLDWEDNPILYDDYAVRAEKLKGLADDNNIVYNQAHAPFPAYIDGDDEYNKSTFELIIKSFECCKIMGIPHIIVHPGICKVNQRDKNLKFYNSLLPYAKSFGVKIALENMWTVADDGVTKIPCVCSEPADFIWYMQNLDKEWFVACLDLGHTLLVGEDTADFIIALGDYNLVSLHVHDNDGKDDLHMLPCAGINDWNRITKALAQINYSGDFTFETGYFLNRIPDDAKYHFGKLMHNVGRHLINLIDSY
jgi:L-ribulose-5-phosphate 3-epimerase